MSDATGKKVIFKQISLDDFKKSLPFVPVLFADGMSYQEEFGGYFGPGTEELVA